MTQPRPPRQQQNWEAYPEMPDPYFSFKQVIFLHPPRPRPWSQQQGSPDSTGPTAALLSLSRLVREFVAQNNTVQIKHVIQTLSQEFALSQHPHSRKGGLIGLAACSIALGKVGLEGRTHQHGLDSDLRPSRTWHAYILLLLSPHST